MTARVLVFIVGGPDAPAAITKDDLTVFHIGTDGETSAGLVPQPLSGNDASADQIMSYLKVVPAPPGNGPIAPAPAADGAVAAATTGEDPILPHLSSRERQVLAHIASGLTHGQTATRMRLTKATVDTYVERIRRKLGAGNKADLTRAAVYLDLCARSTAS